MANDDQQLDETVENEETTTPVEKRESEETSEDLDSLFEDSDPQETPVTREELKRLEKGIKVLASKIGREKVQEPKGEQPTQTGVNPVLKGLYFKANPEAQVIWDEVEKEAKLLGKDPFELYESSSYLRGEAKTRTEAKRVEEEAKSKINKPSSGTDSPKLDIRQVKPEEVSKLKPSEKIEWLKAQAEKERQSD